ncbi:uncharacterized protein LOC114515614 [Dendronephthya gigantea]|uniref:uncharacterized protein LOC114515614 n=1 Tax=Dendronephthya gigantea TaxID=151771 RepID=UPI001068F0FE|nr:uncharacterized protein LOC114515614 [Dendronephthya gigantea]
MADEEQQIDISTAVLAEATQEEKDQEKKIRKEIEKLQFYLEDVDELIEAEDLGEIKQVCKRTLQIQDKLNDLVSHLQELKIELGRSTQRAIRQWTRDLKAEYTPLCEKRTRLCRILEDKERTESLRLEEEKAMRKMEKEELMRRRIQQQEKELWEERMKAEIAVAERKFQLEKEAKASKSKLPELKITPFKGTSADWIRFENMFVLQVDSKSISDAEKFGYLLELVNPKVKDRLSNLKPGTEGYKMAWERLKVEYGHNKLVTAAHVEEIIKLQAVKGRNYEKVCEFYETLCKNCDALATLDEEAMLKGLVVSTLNKLPQVKPDLVRMDDNWEDWDMKRLLVAIQGWLKRNKTEETTNKEHDNPRKRERNWYTQKGGDSNSKGKSPVCIYCEGQHWGDQCTSYDSVVKRRQFFVEKRLCFNCGRAGHRESKCRSRGCYKCKGKHHTSLCDKPPENGDRGNHNAMLNGYSPSSEEKSLPAIVPLKIKGKTFWAYLDTGSGKNFISKEAARQLKLSPQRHERRNILTVNGSKTTSMPVFEVTINAVDGRASETIEITGTEMPDFTTVKRPTFIELKEKYEHVRGKTFYRSESEEYPIHVILGDATYCKIRTDQVYKGKPEDPIVEGTTFGWVVHGGHDYADSRCMFVRENRDYEQLYSLDVLGVEDRGEQDQSTVYVEFQENIVKQDDGRYEVSVPWIPGAVLSNTNEEPSRKRLNNVNRKLNRNQQLKREYEKIVNEQLKDGIIEKTEGKSLSERVFYMPHKPVVKENASTTKVRMVFDASARPHPLANSVNECMHTGPPLQPLLWDILIRARMSIHLLLADLQKAFLQVGLKNDDRDAFRFLFNINGIEEHLRFTRIPFGVEASPFMLGATLQHHFDLQREEYGNTVESLKENTYVDNLMKTGRDVPELENFKREATIILEDARFPVHKWESNVEELDNEANPSKILGHKWDKRDDTLEILTGPANLETPITKRHILKELSSVYDPLGIISPTMVEGKSIYREACDEKGGWNAEVSPKTAKDWIKWRQQLRNVRVPRSLARDLREIKAIHLHLFADASFTACSAVTIAVIEHSSGIVRGLLTSKSRIAKRNTSIARLELVGGHMAANMAKNLVVALRRWPITTVTIWMDSLVALFWISSPERPWKVFVSNRTRKIAEITAEIGIVWKYCPSEDNLADLGSRGAGIDKMEKGGWFAGPQWLVEPDKWPKQPKLERTKSVVEEQKPLIEDVFHTTEKALDEWDSLLSRSNYWRTLRVTAWVLRFSNNARAQSRRTSVTRGPLTTRELEESKARWVKKAQMDMSVELKTPGWEVVQENGSGLLKCKGRIPGYQPIYLEGGEFADKLIMHTHNEINHFGVANTMAALRETWWIPRLRSKVKRIINNCNVCKAYRVKPYGHTATADMPSFRIQSGRPFETTGVDFAGPLSYKLTKKEDGKCYILIFTCATSRAVHLELTKSQSAEEFKTKLNAFITRRSRPKMIVSDNGAAFKATATWIKKIRKGERLQDYLARQEISWKFNFSKSPWWDGMYERLLKDIKKTLYKVLGRSTLSFDQLEAIVIDVEKNVNNRPLTYVESEQEEEQVLTPNTILWGQNVYTIDESDTDDEDEVLKLHKRVKQKRQHAWQRWKAEYVHSLMEHHRVNRGVNACPEVGEIVLVLGEEKNRAEWRRGKVVQLIKGKDNVVRGVKILTKGHTIERPLPLVCSLELKQPEVLEVNQTETDENPATEERKSKRRAAKEAEQRIRGLMIDEED